MDRHDRKLARTCVRCVYSCAMDVQTDIYMYIYISYVPAFFTRDVSVAAESGPYGT